MDNNIATNIIRIFSEMVEWENDKDRSFLTLDSQIKDIPLNSILFIRILVEIEDIYQIKFGPDEMDMTEYCSLSDLITVIQSKLDLAGES